MTIWEYLADPGPWFNTDAYTVPQIAMFTLGALLWVAVYVVTIRRLVTFKELAIPFLAVTLNIGTEITTAVLVVPDMGSVLVIAYWAWLVLDLFIQNAPPEVRAEHTTRAKNGTADLDQDLAKLRHLMGDRFDTIRDNLPELLDRYGRIRDPDEMKRALASWRRRRQTAPTPKELE